MKESRQAGSLLGLLVYYLSEGVKAGWESFRSAVYYLSDGVKAGWESLGLLVYYLNEGVKAGWESFRSAGLLP